MLQSEQPAMMRIDKTVYSTAKPIKWNDAMSFIALQENKVVTTFDLRKLNTVVINV